MDYIFNQAKDKNVAAIKLYGKTADHKVYLEPAYTTQITQAALQDAFLKGMVLVVGDDTLIPLVLNGNVIKTVAKTGEPTAEFDATETYAVGDVVLKDDVAYKCKTAIAVAAAWDATKWDEIVTVDFIEWTAVAQTN